METFKEFKERINSFQKRTLDLGNEYFKVNQSLAQKVGKDNKFKNFYGDTVVFALDSAVKQKLSEWSDLLYVKVPECFCEKLASPYFHMTLHDLSGSASLTGLSDTMSGNQLKITEKREEIQKFANCKIKVKSNYIFNMVGLSLVLGLQPADGGGYRKLTELYSVFDGIKPLSYPFTPHITLAYFNVNGFSARSAKILEETVNTLNKNQIEIELDADRLFYQRFTGMNGYKNIIKLCQ